ncbi:MAG: hypothetical protein EXQ56_12730 [Acidobacteria bacterium]|nr:hypothetical protein [Acidobacteriota bacterium]
MGPTPNPYFAGFDKNRDQLATLDYKKTYSTFLNSFRVGFTRSSVYADSLPVVDIDPTLRFLPGAKTVGNLTFSTSTAGAPLSDFGTATGAERFFVVNQYDYQDQVFYYRGAHSMQFGAQIQRIQHNENFQNSLRGAFQFSDFESFLLARPTLFRAPDPSGGGDAEKAYRMNFISVYAQDDYKLRPNLTLNLGLRYEVMSVPVEARGDRIANFQTRSVNGERVVNTLPTLGSLFFKPHHKSLAPRVGFAWDQSGNGSLAIRGGFGIFYDQLEN